MRLQLIGAMTRWRRLRTVSGIALVVMLTAGAPWLEAATRLVNDSTGSDAGTCTGSPCKTIGYAVGQAVGGDTVSVAPGTYAGETWPVPLKNNVQIIGQNKATTIVQPPISGKPAFEGTTDLVAATKVSGFTIERAAGGTLSTPLMNFKVADLDDMALEISGNDFVGYTAGNDQGINVLDDDPAGAGSFTALIQNNTFTNLEYGVYMNISSVSSGGEDNFSPTIRSNTFTDNTYGVGYTFDLDAEGTYSPLIGGSDAADGNTFTGGTHALYFYGYVGDITFSPTVQNNTVTGTSSYGVYSEMPAYATRGGDATVAPIYSDNTISGTGANGISLSYSDYSTAEGTFVYTPTITHNTITNTDGDGIEILMSYLSQDSGSVTTFSPVITDNIIGDDLTTIANNGVEVYAYYMTDGDYISNITISGNTITGAINDGITVDHTEFTASAIDNVQINVTIANNTISDSGGDGILASYNYMSQTWSGSIDTTITGNTVTGSGGNGILISDSSVTNNSAARNFVVKGNQVDHSTDDGIHVYTDYEAADFDHSVTIAGNTVTQNDGTGVYISESSMSLVSYEGSMHDNLIDSNGGDGLYLYLDYPPGQMIVSCNTITNNDGDGVDYAGASTSIAGSASISNPKLRTSSALPAANFGDGTTTSPGDNVFSGNDANNVGDSDIGGAVTDYDFQNDDDISVKAQGNYWGTTNTATIDANIYDNSDNAAVGVVDYSNFRTTAPTHTAAADIGATVQTDADSSNTPTVGDTLRFCTTVAATGDCGPSTVTVSIPLPSNVTLVPGSVTADHGGAYDPNQPDITVTGITLDAGESATVCFDVVADSGSAVTMTATASAANTGDSTDTVTVTLGAVEPPPPGIPTYSEWMMILMSVLLAVSGMWLARRRRGTIAMMMLAAFALALPMHATPANKNERKHTHTQAQKNEKPKVATLTGMGSKISAATADNASRSKVITLKFADGTTIDLPAGKLRIHDERVSKEERKTTRAAEVASPKHHKSSKQKLDPQDLAALIAHGDTVPMTIMVRREADGSVKKATIILYPTLESAQKAVTDREIRKAEGKAKHAVKQKKANA
jgi:uncharacterized repeat protein (TIGR01451 family)